MRSALRTPVLLFVAAAVLVGCGSDSDSSSGDSFDLTAANLAWSTNDIHLSAGETTFVVKNEDAVEHNLTINGGKADTDVGAKKTVKIKANLTPGTYSFICEYHPDTMKGTIVVS